MENDTIINDHQTVCNVFNNFFINTATDIGPDSRIDTTDPNLIENIINEF